MGFINFVLKQKPEVALDYQNIILLDIKVVEEDI